jgi:Tfp pilus assembly protein PilN
MRAVNLMPADARAARRTRRGGPAYMLLGALAALVVLASFWTVASRQAGDRRAQLDRADAQSAAAEARASAAQPYEEFARLAQDRVATVTALARTRFDWAHAMREISRLLPADVWLTELGGTSGATPVTPSPTTSVAPFPAFKLDGCTRSQARVAQLMARMRAVDGVRDVVLMQSQKPESSGDESCPANRPSDPRFTIGITFAVPHAPKPTLDATGQILISPTSGAAPGAAAPASTPAAQSTSPATDGANGAT